jgi:hypothetical protein
MPDDTPPERATGRARACPRVLRYARLAGRRQRGARDDRAVPRRPARSRPKVSKLAANDPLREYVQDRPVGMISHPDGEMVPGPEVRWVGRRHGRRADRRWATAWSPEQISNRLRVDFPDDASMRISHEAIYQALYMQGRGALTRELIACLRTGRSLRVPRARSQGRGPVPGRRWTTAASRAEVTSSVRMWVAMLQPRPGG